MKKWGSKQKTQTIAKTFALLAATWTTSYIIFYALPQDLAQIKTALMTYMVIAGLPSIFLGPPLLATKEQTIDYIIPMIMYWLAVSMLATEIYDLIGQKKNRNQAIAETVFILLLMILMVLYVLVGLKIYKCQI